MKYSIVEMEMKADVRLQAIIRRGDIFMAELPKGIGCEQGGRRPGRGNSKRHRQLPQSFGYCGVSHRRAQETDADPCAAWQGAGTIPPLAVIVRVNLYDRQNTAWAVHRTPATGENFADGSRGGNQYRAAAHKLKKSSVRIKKSQNCRRSKKAVICKHPGR